ncbi:polysaccharide deacetylase family protein [Nocardioides anomalus]|uniref:Polysaccharide deacetylase family protein n=1 Tax=Nocardioides anomalus TaxID=2712223 RepID=A0A6G6WIF3_9ACTN|nr:polysaccharide deacetylase family protein [Nocardioides anomalus]QIG44999.1 polysaccharide deacetylase family protein [Nocardioides anomalus]
MTQIEVARADGRGRCVALTVDDGPAGATTAALLDLLAEHAVPATFCLVGERAAGPGAAPLVRRVVAEGHVLANHGWSYDDLGAAPVPRVADELARTTAAIRAAAGDPDVPVPFYRAPNGSWGCSADVAAAQGMRPLAVTGTIDDWLTQDADTLVERLRAARRPGGLLLVHDGGGDRSGTLAALRRELPRWLAEGWTFVRPVGWAGPAS